MDWTINETPPKEIGLEHHREDTRNVDGCCSLPHICGAPSLLTNSPALCFWPSVLRPTLPSSASPVEANTPFDPR